MKDSIRSRVLVPMVLLAAPLLAQQHVWHRASPPTSPSPRNQAGMAYDAARKVMVLFGGLSAASSRDTWEYDGTTWRTFGSASGPAADHYARLVYDTARARVVMIAYKTTTQVWEWNGATWSLTSATGGPNIPGFACAYDERRQVIVLYGGAFPTALTGTWEWNGASWQQRSSGGPPLRQNPMMVFDSKRGVSLLFGGYDYINSFTYGDTWEWNGTAWYEHFGIAGPSPRERAGMAYDPQRGRTVLFGGYRPGGSGIDYGDTWEFDGTAWLQIAPITTPPPTSAPSFAWDTTRSRGVLFGGISANQHTNTTWELLAVASVPATYTVFGAGCAGSAGQIGLAAEPNQLPWIGGTFTVRLSQLPTGVTHLPFGLLGTSRVQWGAIPLPFDLGALGAPGCSLHVSGDFVLPLTNLGGHALWTLPLPNNLSLVGQSFFQQGVVLDNGFNALGMTVSNAADAKIGIH